jgi:hypothetical protein
LNAVNDAQRKAIVKTAEALVKAPKPVLFKELEPVIPCSSDVEIIDCDDDDEDDDNDKAVDNKTVDDNEAVDCDDETVDGNDEAVDGDDKAVDGDEEAVDGDDEAADEDVMEVDDIKAGFEGEELEDDDFED